MRSSPRYYEEELPRLLGEATQRIGPLYGAVLVDEAQDFRKAWWPLLLGLHRHPTEGYLFLFADSSQNLYGGSVPEDLVPVEVPLTANLRNTKRIHEFVSVFHEGEVAPTARGPEGRPVDVLAYRDDEELVRLLTLVLKNLETDAVPLEDVVILTPASAAKSALQRRGQANGYRFSSELVANTVLISTVHGFKGLERPVVILAEIGERQRERLAQYLYVGGSRARNQLIVLAEVTVRRNSERSRRHPVPELARRGSDGEPVDVPLHSGKCRPDGTRTAPNRNNRVGSNCEAGTGPPARRRRKAPGAGGIVVPDRRDEDARLPPGRRSDHGSPGGLSIDH